jgi:hypothetical protein
MTKWQSFKDWCKSVKRHKYLYLIIIVLSFLLYRTVTHNYSFQQPIVNIRSESYTDVWNSRAVCLTDLQFAQDAVQANNLAGTADVK